MSEKLQCPECGGDAQAELSARVTVPVTYLDRGTIYINDKYVSLLDDTWGVEEVTCKRCGYDFGPVNEFDWEISD